MEEIAPGLWYWTARRETIGKDVSSYYLASERVVDRPDAAAGAGGLVPAGARDPHLPPPQPRRLEDRSARSWVVEQGAHELEGRGEFRTFAWGDELPGGILACEVDALSPDETALHIPAHSALAIGDGVVRWEGVDGLTFVPDFLMDDPEKTREGLRAAYRRLLAELEFDHLLLAHGAPVLGTAKAELQALVDV